MSGLSMLISAVVVFIGAILALYFLFGYECKRPFWIDLRYKIDSAAIYIFHGI